MSSARPHLRRTGGSVLGLLLLVTPLAVAPPASAAPAIPDNLAPSGSTSSGTPVLSWARSSGAVKYEVQIDNGDTFSTPLARVTTTNQRTVPTRALPEGTMHWRVRSISSSGTASAWATQEFAVSPTAAPSPLSPADGADLAQPQDPPLLAWSAVQGATSYQIEVDTEDDFIGATTYTTKTASFVIPDPADPRDYFWRVRAQRSNGAYTLWSDPRSFEILPLAPVTTTYPADNADTSVEDVVLEWKPVPGATSYEIRVSTDQDFNTITDTEIVYSTRYSPPTTYLNNQYYWQVRARNVAGKATEWPQSPIVPATFRRHWPDRPALQHPAPAQSPQPVGDDFYFQWSPVDHASRYQLDVGSDPNFSPDTYDTCYTAGTTYAAGYLPTDRCMPGQGVVTYWRVRALDEPANVQGIYSETGSFIYSSAAVLLVSPTNGSTVDVPTLQWQASREAEQYQVTLTNGSGSQVASTKTYSLSWTPTTKLDPAKGPYRWTVQAIDTDGSLSPKYSGWQFDVSGQAEGSTAAPLTPLNGVAGQAPTTRFPVLRWAPDVDAAYYRLKIGVAGSGYWYNTSYAPILNQKLVYNTATDTSDKLLNPGYYDWQVEAFSSDNVSLGSGPVGTFRIADLAPVRGQQLALTGTSLDAGEACAAFLDDPSTDLDVCTNLPSTPVLDWDPVPGAAHYMLYVAQDREFTNMVYSGTKTKNTRWSPNWTHSPKALPDSQAGKAFYWFVRPCKSDLVCAPDPISSNKAATHAFDKQSPAVQPTAPAAGATVENDVTFTWEDYLTTNQATPYTATGEKSLQAARTYRIQVATNSTFTSVIDTEVVDQATYTAYDNTYPEGELYWRVQAIDGHGNYLTWSPTRRMVKASPAPVLRSPSDGVVTSGVSPFRWSANLFAGSYQLEVYREPTDSSVSTFSSVNRVLTATSKQAAFSPQLPVPASSSKYVWRLRRLDAKNRPGQWAVGEFYSKGTAPSLLGPSHNTYVPGNSALFSWNAVPGAVNYRFERDQVSGGSGSETVKTTGLAWAPTSAVTEGGWQWRVAALDVSGNVLGTSKWRSFAVDATRPRVVKKSPVRTATRTANFVARFSEPVRNVSRTTMKLFVEGRKSPLKASVTISRDRRTATLNPSANLRPGKRYTLRLSSGIRDGAGLTLKATGWSARAK